MSSELIFLNGDAVKSLKVGKERETYILLFETFELYWPSLYKVYAHTYIHTPVRFERTA